MIKYQRALQILKKNKIRIKTEKVSPLSSVNRISSQNVYSPYNYPAANNTAFDGYAINSSETSKLNKKNIKKFKILKSIAAGDNPLIKKIPKFSTVEVMTGAIIKKPFDTVIPIENVIYFPNNNNPKYIIINYKVKKSNHIRFKGSDYKKGQKVISKGQLIKPSHILAFKTLGINNIRVKRKPKIAFFSTGNEISNKIKIPDWKIRNSNNHFLRSFLKFYSVDFFEKKLLRDNDEIKFKNEINKILKSNFDLIITSGAVSAGKYDFIPKIVNKFKLKEFFKGVAIRPGKPFMFAKFQKNIAFFGLPGNPISSAACFRFFVMPYLNFSLGSSPEISLIAKIKSNFTKKKKFTRFIKGHLTYSNKGVPMFEILKGQESFRINSFVKSNAWGLFPDGKSKFKKGNYIKSFINFLE
tara:strand:+ start:2236 stop:3471 length:1236 start_codon:yes stop_codon:yes gene_type:complete